MKKYFVLSFLLLISISLFGCEKEEKPIQNAYYNHGITQIELLYENFYYEIPNTFTAYSPQDTDPNSDKKGGAALWGYGAVLTSLAQAARVNPKEKMIREKSVKAVEGLNNYRFPTLKLYYTSNLNRGGEPYYDDNAWVVLGLHDLAIAYNNSEYMTKSREVLDYVLSGESIDGGIFWKETVVSRNTCSCGPAIVGALLHYKNNPEDELLTKAERIYQWTKEVLRDPTDYVYWDNAVYDFVNDIEVIEKTKWTYNSGTMIWAGVLLYEVTGKEEYLNDAKLTAGGALAHFYRKNVTGQYHYPNSPWFNLYLMRGFLELARTLGDGSVDYMVNTFKTSMNNAILKSKDERGVIMRSWGSGSSTASDKFVDVLDISATAEVLFLLADFQLNIEKIE